MFAIGSIYERVFYVTTFVAGMIAGMAAALKWAV